MVWQTLLSKIAVGNRIISRLEFFITKYLWPYSTSQKILSSIWLQPYPSTASKEGKQLYIRKDRMIQLQLLSFRWPYWSILWDPPTLDMIIHLFHCIFLLPLYRGTPVRKWPYHWPDRPHWLLETFCSYHDRADLHHNMIYYFWTGRIVDQETVH